MSGVDGLRATHQITADPDLAGVHVLILTTFDHDEYVIEALGAGAAGFLIKNTEPAQLTMLVDYLEAVGAPDQEPLRLALLSGDWIPLDLPGRLPDRQLLLPPRPRRALVAAARPTRRPRPRGHRLSATRESAPGHPGRRGPRPRGCVRRT